MIGEWVFFGTTGINHDNKAMKLWRIVKDD